MNDMPTQIRELKYLPHVTSLFPPLQFSEVKQQMTFDYPLPLDFAKKESELEPAKLKSKWKKTNVSKIDVVYFPIGGDHNREPLSLCQIIPDSVQSLNIDKVYII